MGMAECREKKKKKSVLVTNEFTSLNINNKINSYYLIEASYLKYIYTHTHYVQQPSNKLLIAS